MEMNKKQKVSFFKSEFKRYVKLFNLLDYAYFYQEIDGDSYCACIDASEYNDTAEDGQRNIVLRWSKQWINDEKDKYGLSAVAFHEALEVALNPLRQLASHRDILVTNREVDLEVHRIIRIFENTIFKKVYKK
jgi:hypothetical protein